jgi:O-antigen ligase
MRVSLKNSIFLLIAIASTFPFTIDGFFISYFYILLVILPFYKLRYSPTRFSLLAIYTFIFLAGIYKILAQDSYYALRVTSSYIVFIFPFLIAFVAIEDNSFNKFKQAVIFVSLLISLLAIFQIISIGYQGDFYKTKEIMGTNRIGFVIIFAFFILLFERGFSMIVKAAFLAILFIGLALTFSRSSIVAFGAALCLMGVLNLKKIKASYFLGGIVFGMILLVIFRETIIGQIVDFFSKYLLSYKNYNLTNSQTSEGYRVYVFNQIISYVMYNPLFGSNYAGLYLLYDEYREVGASSHNQYTDVLLRTGLVGFITFMYMLFKVSLYYFRKDSGVFYGLMGIIFYGLFHETFKLAHGSFIFDILLSHYLYKKDLQYRMVSLEIPNQEKKASKKVER